LEKMNMNVVGELIGAGVGVAISDLAEAAAVHDVWIADGTRCRVGIHDLALLEQDRRGQWNG
jgi:hypothetical protein